MTLDQYDADVIARAKAQLDKCRTANNPDYLAPYAAPPNYPYLLGGCEEIIRQLLRVIERTAGGAK